MLWSIVAVSVVGLLAGLRFRAAALIAISGVIVTTGVVATARDGGLDRHDLLRIVVVLVVFQCAYLAGIFIGSAWRRAGTSSR